MRLGPVEIGLILIIVLIVFGVGKLPQVGNALGKGMREFRQASKDIAEAEKEIKADDTKTNKA
jgi:sec-independent protein translocase protein TatA